MIHEHVYYTVRYNKCMDSRDSTIDVLCTVQLNGLSNVFSITWFSSYPSCSGAHAPGLAAKMFYIDKVMAFIGPACAFALEPVARLAAYWNLPIITGMGDQVSRRIKYINISCCRKFSRRKKRTPPPHYKIITNRVHMYKRCDSFSAAGRGTSFCDVGHTRETTEMEKRFGK